MRILLYAVSIILLCTCPTFSQTDADQSVAARCSAQPTAAQLQDAKQRFAELDARYNERPDPNGHEMVHIFEMPPSTVDSDLACIPDLDFAFTLVLNSTEVTDDGLAALSQLTNLTGLCLSEATDRGLRELGKLKSLSFLFVDGVAVTDAGATAIRELKALKHLHLSDTSISDKGLKKLAQTGKLRHLGLCGPNVTDDTIVAIKGSHGLRSLWLNGTPRVTDAGLRELRDMPNLTELHLSEDCVEEQDGKWIQRDMQWHIRRLKDIPHLRTFRLVADHLTDAKCAELENLKQLTALEVGTISISRHGIGSIRKMTWLDSIDLSICGGDDLLLAEIGRVVKLKRLTIGDLEITDAGLAHLKELTDLTSLSISFSRITDAGVAALRGMTKLKELDLHGMDVGDESVSHLLGMKRLKELNLSGTNITDTALTRLADLKELTELCIRETRVSDAAIEALKRRLPGCCIIKHVDPREEARLEAEMKLVEKVLDEYIHCTF
jgi:Leucine-rich repeat (LRR) protein